MRTSVTSWRGLGFVAATFAVPLLAQGAAASEPEPAATATATAGSIGPKIEFVDPMAASSLTQAGHDLSPIGMFVSADGIVRTVIVLLLIASAVSWTIGIAKWIELRRERERLAGASAALLRAGGLSAIDAAGKTPVADMIMNAEDEIASAAHASGGLPAEGIKDRVAMRLERLEAGVRRRVGRGLVLLAIIGSSAPFVGLFGTVWGIMNSFIGIANAQTTNLAVVAPGIAEALLTTAVGLITAIPAGVMYNLFARTIAGYGGELADASASILCLAGREIDRRAGQA